MKVVFKTMNYRDYYGMKIANVFCERIEEMFEGMIEKEEIRIQGIKNKRIILEFKVKRKFVFKSVLKSYNRSGRFDNWIVKVVK